jgi:hypothetical protein
VRKIRDASPGAWAVVVAGDGDDVFVARVTVEDLLRVVGEDEIVVLGG